MNYDWDEGVPRVDLIKVYIIQMGNKGTDYVRSIETAGKIVAHLGGLSRSIVVLFAFIDIFFGGAFRQLDLGISF